MIAKAIDCTRSGLTLCHNPLYFVCHVICAKTIKLFESPISMKDFRKLLKREERPVLMMFYAPCECRYFRNIGQLKESLTPASENVLISHETAHRILAVFCRVPSQRNNLRRLCCVLMQGAASARECSLYFSRPQQRPKGNM